MSGLYGSKGIVRETENVWVEAAVVVASEVEATEFFKFSMWENQRS